MSKPKLLIIEDDDIFAISMQEKLIGFGYDVIDSVATGEEAIELLENVRPDLVLMDINLPGKYNGIETAKIIYQAYNVPVIYVTAHSDKITLSKAKASDAYGYITKPVNDRDVKVNIEMALYKHSFDKRLFYIFERISDGFVILDSDFKINFMNSSMEKLLGCDKNECIGKYCYEVLKYKYCEKNCPLKNDTNVEQIKSEIHHSNGLEKKVLINFIKILDDKNNLSTGILHLKDITDIEELKSKLSKEFSFQNIVSKNEKMQQIFGIIPELARSNSNILIEGETGTGKELIAHAIHKSGTKENETFISINCGAIPDSLIESELFGYEAGTFTDAKKKRNGKLFEGKNGVIFLDEIEAMSPSMQVKLLHVLQNRKYEPLGSHKTIELNAQFIFATNKNLEELVNKGEFRKDLYFRINIIKIMLPALKQRKDDIPLLSEFFLNKYSSLKQKHFEKISEDVMRMLLRHDFPGNVRELENIIEHCVVVAKENIIRQWDLPDSFSNSMPDSENNLDGNLKDVIEQVEKRAIQKALDKHNGNIRVAADYLGLPKTTLWNKVKKYNINASV